MKRVLLGCVFLLAGCAGQSATSHQSYLLPDVNQTNLVTSSAPLLVVEVELAPYLDVNGIVYRTSSTEVVEAKQNTWAMDAGDMVQRQVIAMLRTMQSQYWPVDPNPSLKLADQPKLLIKLDKFNGSVAGNAEVSGEWLLLSQSGEIIKGEGYNHTVALEQDGYAALVTALSQALSLTISDVSKQI
ncbi:hypothetical protein BIY22_21300 [Vibrio panuliri]|uniref:ABC-type transport auxiliary lipoprotein component domain-containing protein n=1 Tax=Vibrio panuliri TaxID=1381081 RepID=A0A1Q9HD80_9VIBR|nr:ABC-type transport auxiliary lipoprotein family protein [Vibrio panuliri]OLQ87441.1 hypothetical protein BIY22_21300 [Vibrio panuliri]